MIKIRVANMSCGHCRLKINAELVEAGFKGNEFDMDKDTINIDATLQNLNEAYKAINKIGYIIDKDFRPIISEKITLEVNDLHNKDILDKVVDGGCFWCTEAVFGEEYLLYKSKVRRWI